MGCDGGTIPKRHELVKTAKRPEQKDKDMDRKAKWSTCCITQQPLTQPIVACELGKLYNKESLLEFLLDRSTCETATHVRSLKDVKQLKLTENSGYDKNAPGNSQEYYDTQAAKFVCPIVGLEMNGKYKFCLLWTCGCVMSERAMKEVTADTCHTCGTKYQKDDVIILNAEDEDLIVMEENMTTRREKLKALRREKKEKKGEKRKSDHKDKLENGTTDGFQIPKPLNPLKKKSKVLNGTSKGMDSSSSSSMAKKASVTSDKSAKEKADSKIDITKSKVYKSLFTSSESSKNRGKDQSAHWVTYNPYHL